MPKFRDTKYEDWTPPWGEDEFDAERAKKLIYDLRVDNEIQKERVSEVGTERDAIRSERDELKNQIDSKAREGESEVDRLKREIADRDAALQKAGDKSVEMLRLEAALEVGLERKHIGRLNRDLTTLEELVADAKELQSSFGGSGKKADDDEDTPRGRPRARRNPADPDPGDDDLSVERMLAAVPSNPFS